MFAICIEASHSKGMGHLFRMLNFSKFLKTKNKDFHSYMYNERYRGQPAKVKKDDNCASYCYIEVLLEHEKGFEYFIKEYIN